MRRNPEWQQKMLHAERSANSEWMMVASEIQKVVVTDYLASLVPPVVATTSVVEGALKQLWRAARQHPEIAHYVKWNRVRDCPVKPREVCPNVAMFRPMVGEGGGEACLLLDRGGASPLPLVLIAGSLS